MDKLYLGIDTSCYTTSCALCDEDGRLVFDVRKPLAVDKGARGKRQSEMVFEHINNVAHIFPGNIQGLCAVAVSGAPRRVEGSYMPVFKVAHSLGVAAASAACAKFYSLDHQTAHIAAALIESDITDGSFFGVHVSGGTLDVLDVRIDKGIITDVAVLASGGDISAGQLVDRLGVHMGLPFPAGAHVEELAKQGETFVIPSSVKGLAVSFSGAETAATRAYDAGTSAQDVAASVQKCIAKSLQKVLRNTINTYGDRTFLMFGGVMCNKYIKDQLAGCADVIFAKKEYSSDNACGLALQARKLFRNSEETHAGT